MKWPDAGELPNLQGHALNSSNSFVTAPEAGGWDNEPISWCVGLLGISQRIAMVGGRLEVESAQRIGITLFVTTPT